MIDLHKLWRAALLIEQKQSIQQGLPPQLASSSRAIRTALPLDQHDIIQNHPASRDRTDYRLRGTRQYFSIYHFCNLCVITKDKNTL